MGAIKPNSYTDQDLQLSLVARAMAHPARIRLIKILREQQSCRNIDLTRKLNLSRPAVADHIEKLSAAGMVRIDYFPHHYLISLENSSMNELFGFIGEECA